jgi:hypothetical protein
MERMSPREADAYERVLHAINLMRRERLSLTAAARETGTRPETVRRLAGTALVRVRGRWKSKPADRLERRMLFYDRRGSTFVTVRSSTTASRIGEYHNAIKEFLETGHPSKLNAFRGMSFLDVKGKRRQFLTRPMVIRRLARVGEFRFESIY